MKHRGGTLAEVAHDTRNMVTALGLYCDLLGEPGVLAPEYFHYSSELRLLTAASRRLVEKLMLLDRTGDLRDQGDMLPDRPNRDADLESSACDFAFTAAQSAPNAKGRVADGPIDDLEEELLANRDLLGALSGPGITVTVRAEGGARPVRLSGEDLTRVLVNLVKNAAEAMRLAGTIEITLREAPESRDGETVGQSTLLLSVEDTGPGISEHQLGKVFETGYTTHARSADLVEEGEWPVTHRGLGLSITRSIVEKAGGWITAANRPQGGARFDLELPVRAC
jgi:signal transduction histidine kinase